jgi:hypothetical protein
MIQAVLNKLFNKVDIMVNGAPGAPIYLRRWFIWPRKPEDNKMVPRIYLHRFYTGDNVRDLHDHPWSFDSIILWGGYWEHSYNPEWLRLKAKGLHATALQTPKTIRKWYGPGSFLKRGASWTHAVELKKKKVSEYYGFGAHIDVEKDVPCWSLVLTGIKSRSWGFHTEGGWCHWKNYHSGACVCYDNPNEEIPGVTVGKNRKRRTEPKE